MGCILKLTVGAGLAIALISAPLVSAPVMAEKAAAPSPVVKACKADAKKHCPKANAKTEDEIKSCLEKHMEHVGKKCKKALGGGN